MIKRMLPLMGMLMFAWLLIILGSFLIFKVVAPLPNILPSFQGLLITAILKALLAVLLVALWLIIMVSLTKLYVKRKLLR